MSRLTLQKSFFDNLWPLILSDNVCDTLSRNMCRFYEPDQIFDNVWLHAYLADRGFKNYQAPTAIPCCFAKKEENLVLSESTEATSSALCLTEAAKKSEKKLQTEEEELYAPKAVGILTVEQRNAARERNVDQRRKLAHGFINRQYPWYMQQPEYDASFQLTDKVRQDFNSKFEKAVIQDIHTFSSKLILIDLAERHCLHELQRWLKFTRYAFIIVMARSENAVKQIKLMGPHLSAVMLVENMEYTWQEQLTESLRVGVAHASSIGHFEHCTKSFVFIFSRNRNSCKSNTHRVLRRKT